MSPVFTVVQRLGHDFHSYLYIVTFAHTHSHRHTQTHRHTHTRTHTHTATHTHTYTHSFVFPCCQAFALMQTGDKSGHHPTRLRSTPQRTRGGHIGDPEDGELEGAT